MNTYEIELSVTVFERGMNDSVTCTERWSRYDEQMAIEVLSIELIKTN